MADHITITNDPPAHPVLDYELLRTEGIKHFQQMAGQQWTDHNIHDPGITIWEQVCYALTDLGYRLDFDLKDILAGAGDEPFKDLFSAATILSVAPVSLSDYRKLVIDVAGVRNAWLEAVESDVPIFYDPNTEEILTQPVPPGLDSSLQQLSLKGLYRVLLAADQDGVKEEVEARLHANRSLGMDFTEVIVLPSEKISLFTDIEIRNVEDPVRLLGEIFYQLDQYVAPQIPFYSLSELVNEGWRNEDIFDGPILEHGFIKNEELDQFKRLKDLRASDMIQLLMDIEGVAVIRKFEMAAGNANQREKWILPLDTNSTPQFNIGSSQIRFFRGGLEIKVDVQEAEAYAAEKKRDFNVRAKVDGGYDLSVATGKDRNIANYFSLQNHFPDNFGIGERGLAASASPARKGEALQLKAYLSFFEQLLINFFAQTANAWRLFSFSNESNRSYFSKGLQTSIHNFKNLLQSPLTHVQRLKEITETEEAALVRKKRFLNHLLARFSEQFTEYSLVLYGAIAGSTAESNTPQTIEVLTNEVSTRKAFLQHYPSISARRHIGINYAQGDAWDSSINISGLKKRISLMLGLETFSRTFITQIGEQFEIISDTSPSGNPIYEWEMRNSQGDLMMRSHRDYPTEALAQLAIHQFIALARYTENYSVTPSGRGLRVNDADGILARRDNLPSLQASLSLQETLMTSIQVEYIENTAENFHMLEHILLRPIRGQFPPEATQVLLSSVPRKDPYSLQLSFTLPNWAGRFQDPAFRRFAEQLIRQETPAHLSVFIHWMDWAQMASFEEGYRSWLQALIPTSNN